MKAIKIDGEIKIFNALPKVWNDENGTHFNLEDGYNLGFKDVVTPTHDSRIEELSNLHLSGNVYTYDVIDKVINETLGKLKEQKINSLNEITRRELSKTDWYLVRHLETEKIVPEIITNERANLRTQSNDIEAEINALATKKEVLIFDLPQINIL